MNKALETSAQNSWMETFIDRDKTPREPLRFGIDAGIAWGVVNSPIGALNGYAWIPREGHPWSTVDDYDDERLAAVEIHGGLTYCSNGWIGFDTVHAWDIWDPAHLESVGVSLESGRRYLMDQWNDTVWTIELVEDEARNLARQIAGAA